MVLSFIRQHQFWSILLWNGSTIFNVIAYIKWHYFTISMNTHTINCLLGIFALYMYVQNQFPFLFAQYVKNVILNLNKHDFMSEDFFCNVKDVKTKLKTKGNCFLPNMLVSLLELKKCFCQIALFPYNYMFYRSNWIVHVMAHCSFF